MIKRVLVFLYVFTQILFYDNLTIVPKLVGVMLVISTISSLNVTTKKSLTKAPIVCLFLLLLHAIVSVIFYPNLEYVQGLISFTLIAVLLYFFYLTVLVHQLWRTAIWGFVLGIYVNFFLVLFFPTSFELAGEWGRVDGTLGNANYFGFMVNFSIVFYIWLKETSTVKIPIILDLVVFSISAYHIILSGSKSNMCLFVLVVFTLLIMTVINSGKIKLLKHLILIITLSLSVFVFLPNIFSDLIDNDSSVFRRLIYMGNFISGDRILGSSDLTRLELVKFGLLHWLDKPFFGHGFDSFSFMSGFGYYSHNNIVENLYNGGIFGFTVFYSLYLFYFRSFKVLVSQKIINVKIPILLLIIFVVMEFFIVMIILFNG